VVRKGSKQPQKSEIPYQTSGNRPRPRKQPFQGPKDHRTTTGKGGQQFAGGAANIKANLPVGKGEEKGNAKQRV